MDPWTIFGRGPQWIGGTELARAWPPAAPVCKDAGQGAGEGEWNVGNLMIHSPELGRQRGGPAMVVRVAAVRTPMRGALGAPRVENGGAGMGREAWSPWPTLPSEERFCANYCNYFYFQ
jgi:hypothetical protein